MCENMSWVQHIYKLRERTKSAYKNNFHVCFVSCLDVAHGIGQFDVTQK